MKFIILLFAIFITTTPAFSQNQIQIDVSEENSAANKNFAERWWDASVNKVSKIYNEGRNDFYLTVYAYHDRFTYTPEKLRELNEGAYGFGFGRSKINENGNTEMLFAMSHLDSHSDVQVNAGYAWVKNFHITESVKLGLGFAAGLVSRSDFAGRIPIPFALPMGTIDIMDRYSINAILIPKLNDGINNGNVLFLFGKFTWDKIKM